MPRTLRAAAAGYCYHVLNRGNGQAPVFHKPDDYRAFLALMNEASLRIPMRVLGYCLMPNHFHLALWPSGDDHLSRWMHWLMTSHVRRYLGHYQFSGHVWQGRFKAFPVEEETHLLTILRYIERNPLRAGLVDRAEFWPWSSLGGPDQNEAPIVRLDPGPLPRGPQWTEHVNSVLFATEEEQIRDCIRRDRPFGRKAWTETTAKDLGLESSLRKPGRPRKTQLIGDRPGE